MSYLCLSIYPEQSIEVLWNLYPHPHASSLDQVWRIPSGFFKIGNVLVWFITQTSAIFNTQITIVHISSSSQTTCLYNICFIQIITWIVQQKSVCPIIGRLWVWILMILQYVNNTSISGTPVIFPSMHQSNLVVNCNLPCNNFVSKNK